MPFEEICARIARGYPSVGQLGEILALHGSDPFAAQELARLIARESTFVERMQISYSGADARARPPRRPFTARDMMEIWGYRAVHCTTVGNALADILGPRFRSAEFASFWRWTFAVSCYAAVLADVLRVHEDEAFAGAFLRNVSLLLLQSEAPGAAAEARAQASEHDVPLWQAEAIVIGGSHLDLGRYLARLWELPAPLLPAFDQDSAAGSLPDLLVRALAAAARHGFRGPVGDTIPQRLIADREPILDAYLRRHEGPEGVAAQFRVMMSTARVPIEDPATPRGL